MSRISTLITSPTPDPVDRQPLLTRSNPSSSSSPSSAAITTRDHSYVYTTLPAPARTPSYSVPFSSHPAFRRSPLAGSSPPPSSSQGPTILKTILSILAVSLVGFVLYLAYSALVSAGTFVNHQLVSIVAWVT